MTRSQLNSEFVVASVSVVHSAQADGQRVVSLPSHPEEDTGGLLRVGSLAFAICASHETGSSPGFQPGSE